MRIKPMNTIFHKILKKEIPSNIEYEDDNFIVIHDISPQAPIHLLIIPKTYIATINDIGIHELHIMTEMIKVVQILAVRLHVDQSGYRLIMNCNPDGGQTIYYLHMHFLAGKELNLHFG
jgi:histidine triad (HIT) family protein